MVFVQNVLEGNIRKIVDYVVRCVFPYRVDEALFLPLAVGSTGEISTDGAGSQVKALINGQKNIFYGNIRGILFQNETTPGAADGSNYALLLQLEENLLKKLRRYILVGSNFFDWSRLSLVGGGEICHCPQRISTFCGDSHTRSIE